MYNSRDEERRASAYIASTKPLFQARNIERKFFTRSRVSRGEPVVSPGNSPSSRIPLPRNTSSPKATTSLRDAYERALREEDSPMSVNGPEIYTDVGGSPSPAPRPRPTGVSQHERDEHRMRKLREGMRVVTNSPIGQEGENYPVSPLEDDGTIRSNGSGGSGLSPEEEFTDQWLKEMKRAANDQRRKAAALDSKKPLFTRGGLGARVTETAQTLVRKSSVSSLESEPGVRIPRTWGRHARKNPGWLNRVHSPERSEEMYGVPQQVISEGSIDWTGAAEDALASVENGSSAYEPTPPHSRPNSAQHQNFSSQRSHIWDLELDFTAQSVQESTSPLLKVRNTKLDEIRAREMQLLSKQAVATARLEEIQQRNFAGRSESPNGTTLIARIAEQKHQSEAAERWVEKRFRSVSDAEDSSRLEALAKIAANTALPDESSVQDAETKVPHEAQLPQEKRIQDTKTKALDESLSLATMTGKEILPVVREPIENESDIKVPFLTESFLQDYTHEKTTILEEEGEHIPGTPVTIFRGKGVNEKKPSQLGHSRDDSWENLRKLSQVLSATPSPAINKLAERPSDESLKNVNRLSVDIKRSSGASTPPKSDIDPEERIVSEVSLFELQDDKPERNSLRTPSPAGDHGVDETPRPKADPLTLPTPIVTGAYIDTPAPRGRQPKTSRPSSMPPTTGDTLHEEVSKLCLKDYMRGSSSHSTTLRKEVRTTQRGTEHGGSSLSSSLAAQSARRKPNQRSRPPLINSAHLTSAEDDLKAIQQAAEDSTLDEFDGLILASEDDSEPNSTTNMEPLIDLEKDEKGRLLSAAERQRKQDMIAIARMNKTIKSGLVSIRDAKRGIERLEDQVSSTPEPLEHNHDQESCPKCASDTANPSFHFVTVPIPRLWAHDATKWSGISLTWLGFLLVLFVTWLLLESTACDLICHPEYASDNNWSPNDPFWGAALPTLINRHTGGIIGYIFKALLWVSRLFLRGASGLDTGWADGSWDADEVL